MNQRPGQASSNGANPHSPEDFKAAVVRTIAAAIRAAGNPIPTPCCALTVQDVERVARELNVEPATLIPRE